VESEVNLSPWGKKVVCKRTGVERWQNKIEPLLQMNAVCGPYDVTVLIFVISSRWRSSRRGSMNDWWYVRVMAREPFSQSSRSTPKSLNRPHRIPPPS
jgi:hypothetical protein